MKSQFEVIIIGVSYAGLSAAMSLGRAMRNVLVIDSGLPCNRQTPLSHNVITLDGEKPADIAAKAREQVLQYPTVQLINDVAVNGRKTDRGFEIGTRSGKIYEAEKLIFAAGVKDLMPDIPGFAECWGVSVIHCPYCHGWEVRDRRLGVLAMSAFGLHQVQMVRQWSEDVVLFLAPEVPLEAELERRRAGWTPATRPVRRGVLGKYAKLVRSANVGAVCS